MLIDGITTRFAGDGPLEISGSVNLGFYENQTISLPYLILDSTSTPSISGVANLVVYESFVWRRGTVAGPGSLNTQIGSQTMFETFGNTKALSATTCRIAGNVSGDSNVDLTLADGAILSLEYNGRWMQPTGGQITQGLGDAGRFEVIGEFHKTGEGAFVVTTDFTCSGILDLTGGAFNAQGDFSLTDSGVITGGGTADIALNPRLILLEATSAVMRGTIRPDLDGAPARMEVQGLVDLESTFRMELDIVTSGEFNTESVFFMSGGQVFGGTLALNALSPAEDQVDYQVVYSVTASGEFAVTGDEQFDTIIQSPKGVVLRR